MDTVNKLRMPDGKGIEVMGEWDEGTKKLHNSHKDVKYIVGNADNNIGITVWCRVGTRIIHGIPVNYIIV